MHYRITCAKCGREALVSHKHGRYCSKSCGQKARWDRQGRKPDLSPGPHFYDGHWWIHLKNGKRTRGQETNCLQCGKWMITGVSAPHRHIYCGYRCLHDKRSAPIGSVRAETRYLLERVDPDDPIAGPMRRRAASGYRSYYVWQHRLVMARALRRPLERHETVHHVNGDPHDNRLENLQLRSGPHGKGQVARCGQCGSTHIVFDEVD